MPNQPGRIGFHQSSAGATCGRTRRNISRPCAASSILRITYSPLYGCGRGRKTVAWMSLTSSEAMSGLELSAPIFVSIDLVELPFVAVQKASVPSPRRRIGDTNRATAHFSCSKIAVGVSNTGKRVAVLNRLDAPEPGEFDDFAQVHRAAIHAGGELSAPGDFVQSKGDRF